MTSNDGFAAYLASVVEAGIALIVGTSDPDRAPRAGRAWTVAIVADDPLRIRVAVTADDPVLVENMRSGQIAVTGTDVTTFRSFQCKGRTVAVEPPSSEDLAVYAAQTEQLLGAIRATDHTPIDVVRRMMPRAVVMAELVVEQVFDQTPGPNAGSAMAVFAR